MIIYFFFHPVPNNKCSFSIFCCVVVVVDVTDFLLQTMEDIVISVKENAWQGRAGGLDRSLASLDLDGGGFSAVGGGGGGVEKESVRVKHGHAHGKHSKQQQQQQHDLPPIKDAHANHATRVSYFLSLFLSLSHLWSCFFVLLRRFFRMRNRMIGYTMIMLCFDHDCICICITLYCVQVESITAKLRGNSAPAASLNNNSSNSPSVSVSPAEEAADRVVVSILSKARGKGGLTKIPSETEKRLMIRSVRV